MRIHERVCAYCGHEVADPDIIFRYGRTYHQACVMKAYGKEIDDCTFWNCGIWDKDDRSEHQYPDMKFENAEAYQKWYDSFPYSSYHRQLRWFRDTSSENGGFE